LSSNMSELASDSWDGPLLWPLSWERELPEKMALLRLSIFAPLLKCLTAAIEEKETLRECILLWERKGWGKAEICVSMGDGINVQALFMRLRTPQSERFC
jgi:hypothetical protein